MLASFWHWIGPGLARVWLIFFPVWPQFCSGLAWYPDIPVMFVFSYKRPRRKLSSSWWWWWWPFQSTLLLPFGSASPEILDWPMLYYCIVAELSRHSCSAHWSVLPCAGGDSVVITKVSHDLTSFPNSARRFLWNVRLGLRSMYFRCKSVSSFGHMLSFDILMPSITTERG